MFRRLFIASVLCGIGTGIVCSLIWLSVSGVDWFVFPIIIGIFLTNACLAGLISSLLYLKCRVKSLFLSLYLGNTIPLSSYLLISFFQAGPSLEAWYLLYLIGWIVISVVPALITRVLLK